MGLAPDAKPVDRSVYFGWESIQARQSWRYCPSKTVNPVDFASGAHFRRWLERKHAEEREVLLRLRKVGASLSLITYAEALDQALCFGWIDGVRRAHDADSFTTRFTPRKPRSVWSKVNVAHMARLEKLGWVHPAGQAAFARREAKLTGIYSFENRPRRLPRACEKAFREDAGAWAFFAAQPPGYRRVAVHWVMAAKQEATRQRRLARLIASSGAGKRMF